MVFDVRPMLCHGVNISTVAGHHLLNIQISLHTRILLFCALSLGVYRLAVTVRALQIVHALLGSAMAIKVHTLSHILVTLFFFSMSPLVGEFSANLVFNMRCGEFGITEASGQPVVFIPKTDPRTESAEYTK